MLDRSLKNKKIVISAGASGIGLATTKICISRGALVYLCDVDPKAINKIKNTETKPLNLFKFI